jgi:hypothetical protein
MGEKERAEALLQAAGVTGVAVQPAEEMVTMSRAEADVLRAGAAPPAIPSADVSQVPPQVQAHAAEMAASGIVPGGEVTREQLRSMTAHQIAALPPDVVNAALAEGGRS